MKKLIGLLPLAIFLCLMAAGCGSKEKKTVDVTGYTTYSDPVAGFSIKLPTNWYIQKYPGFRVLAYTSKEAAGRFRSYDPEGVSGAKVEMYAVKLENGVTLDSVMKSKFFESNVYSQPQPVTIDGVQGQKQTYRFELTDGLVQGEIYYFAKDSNYATVIDFEAFQSTFDNYRKNFDEILKSAKPAMLIKSKPSDSTVVRELPPPSETLTNRSGEGFSIQISDNFTQTSPRVAGALKTYNFIGERRADANIEVDIFDASKQSDLNKIVNDNKARYRGATPRETNLGGKKAFVFDYTPIAKVRSNVYFAVSNNKLYRVTVNIPLEEEQTYKPIFERSIKSMKIQ